jgi:uncharacterized membrane protein YbaN (DUF454 family)
MTTNASRRERMRRSVLAALGVACAGLAGLGVFVPGLPTTVFLIAASYLFARSSPRLDERLRASRWFGPYLRRRAETGGAMPRPAKAAALVSMWTGIALSLAALQDAFALQAVTVVLGLVGTAAILFRVPTTPSAALAAGVVDATGGPSAARVLQ